MKKYTLLIIVTLVSCATLWAQQSVSGQVKDADEGFGLPGVTVLEKGTNNGTITDVDGYYTIRVAEGAVLTFSFVGYQTPEVAVGNRTNISVNMETDLTELSEIVVIGYGQVQKSDLTGAVASVQAKDFNKGVLTSPQDLLVGRIAGVQVTTNSGAPGSAATIRIRGGSSLSASNDPLIVIDGFPVDNTTISGLSNPLSTINPSDIESFTVLKDASATAIYGARASNGVIIVTTKKGQSGKPKFSVSSRTSVSTPIAYVDVLDGDEYRTLVNDLHEEGFSGINDAALNRLGTENTNWQKEIYQTAISQDVNVNASGAIKDIPFRVSYGYTDQEGILKTTYMKRHSISVNTNPSFFNDQLKVNLNVKETLANTGFGDQGAVGAAVNFDPTQSVYADNTKYGGYFAWTTENLPDGTMDPDGPANTFSSNPVALLKLRNNVADVNRLIGNIQFDYALPFLPGLSANLNLGMDRSNTDGIDDALPGSTWTYRDYTGENGRLLDYDATNSSELLDFYLKYKKDFTDHQLELTGGYSYQHFQREGSTFNRNGDQTQVVEDSRYINENFLISFFGRLNYIFKNKYLLTATLRNDGSSRFTGENRWGLFPALAAGWKISEEGFMSAVPVVSNLKLRLGYGVTGQQDVTSNQYPALPIYRESIGGASYQFGDTFVNTLRPDPYDANIKWEETTTYNVGVDYGFFDDRVYGSVELYKRETRDLINNIPIAAGSNFSNFLITNVGNLENEGVEVTLNVRPVLKPDFTWNIGVNFTHNTNQITKLTKTDDPDYQGVAVGAISGGVGNMIQIHTVGYPANSFYVFQQVYGTDGQPLEGLYVNRTGETGAVTSNELNKYHYYSPAPEALMGFNSRVAYKQFDFSFSSRLSLNNYVYNNLQSGGVLSGLYTTSGGGYFNNITTSAANRGFTNPQYWSDTFVENASFFKMDNISLGYSLDKLFTDAIKLHVSLTVQNAFIITNYDGLDPEVSGGIDNNIYPRPRTFLLGLNLSF